MVALLLEFSPAGDAGDRRVAGVRLHRLGRHRPATLQLAGRRPGQPGQRVETGTDDQLRPRAGAIALATSALAHAAGRLPPKFDQRIGAALAKAPRVVFDGLYQPAECRPQRRATFGIEQAVEPDQAI